MSKLRQMLPTAEIVPVPTSRAQFGSAFYNAYFVPDDTTFWEGHLQAFAITKDCRVECIMKDTHTLSNQPENVVEWCRVAKEEALRA